MLKQLGRVTALSLSLVAASAASADTVILTLDPSEVGSYLSEGTRLPTTVFGGSPQHSRNELFIGYNGAADLLSLRGIFGFDIESLRTGLPSGTRIDNVTLNFHVHDVDSGTVQGLEVWQSPQQVVETEADWDVYSTGNAWSPAFVRGASTGLGAQLSSTTDSYAINTVHDISLSDTTGNFVSTLESAIDNPGEIYTLIVTSLTTEAGPIGALLRIDSDDAGTSVRPTLTIDYTPIRQIASSQFASTFTLLDFESSALGNLDAAADNPSTNALFTSNGISSVTGAAATNQADAQNQNTINDNGLYYVQGANAFGDGTAGRFAIIPDASNAFNENSSGFLMDGGTTYTIDFESVNDQFGVTFIDESNQTMTFTFFLGGVEQGAMAVAVPLVSDQFYGFETPFLFDRVTISGSNTTDGWGLGEIRFAQTPEPGTFVTCALGAIALLRRRQSRRA